MLHLVALRDDLLWRWIARNRALNRFFGRLIVVILNLLVVGGIPMDEHADAYKKIIRLGRRDDTACDTVGNRLGDGTLRRAKHLDRLLGILDRHLVEQDGRGLAHKVWRDHGE